MRKVWLAVAALVVAVFGVAGCTASPASPVSSSVATTSTGAPSKLVVTVPSLAGSTAATSATAPAGSPAAEPSAGSTPEVASQPPADTVPAEPSTTTAPTAPATVAVELANCPDCTVIATAAQVTGGLSAALIGQNGKALLLSVDDAGSVLGASNVPYGATFPAPADGHLSCGPDGRCVLVAAQPDGRAVLSAFQLGADGSWTDQSGSGGFVSATAKGLAVPVEGGYGAAIQVGDESSTVWTVLAWTGAGYGVIGCAPDADEPDLGALAMDTCLS